MTVAALVVGTHILMVDPARRGLRTSVRYSDTPRRPKPKNRSGNRDARGDSNGEKDEDEETRRLHVVPGGIGMRATARRRPHRASEKCGS